MLFNVYIKEVGEGEISISTYKYTRQFDSIRDAKHFAKKQKNIAAVIRTKEDSILTNELRILYKENIIFPKND